MKLPALVLFVLPAVTGCVPKTAAPASVMPAPLIVQMTQAVGPVGSAEAGAFCTAVSINQARRYWLTAAHCVSDLQMAYTVRDAPAVVVMRDVLQDLAVLVVPDLDVPGRPLSRTAPAAGQWVAVAGYQGLTGMQAPVLTFGWIAHPTLVLFPDAPEPWNKPFMLIQAAGAPGSSGSPVLNSAGELVSIVQASWTRGWGQMIMTASAESLAGLAAYWPA